MERSVALARMVPPGQRRLGKYREGVIQVHVTRACNLACFGCTQGSNLAGRPEFISLEHFELAVASLADYFGVVGVFGGNPAMHPQFAELCAILRKYVPFERRGLWCNHPMEHAAEMRRTFDPRVSNLNVHLDAEAHRLFKRGWPEALPVGLARDSRHSPPLVAMKDVGVPEEERWELISRCDINQHWSAMVGVFRGELRAWFCEIAGAQSILHQHEADYPDTGVAVVPGWWRAPMDAFAHQADKHCHECGVPLRIYGELSQAVDGRERVSAAHVGVHRLKRKDRVLELVVDREQIRSKGLSVVDYLGGATR